MFRKIFVKRLKIYKFIDNKYSFIGGPFKRPGGLPLPFEKVIDILLKFQEILHSSLLALSAKFSRPAYDPLKIN